MAVNLARLKFAAAGVAKLVYLVQGRSRAVMEAILVRDVKIATRHACIPIEYLVHGKMMVIL